MIGQFSPCTFDFFDVSHVSFTPDVCWWVCVDVAASSTYSSGGDLSRGVARMLSGETLAIEQWEDLCLVSFGLLMESFCVIVSLGGGLSIICSGCGAVAANPFFCSDFFCVQWSFFEGRPLVFCGVLERFFLMLWDVSNLLPYIVSLG